MLHTTEIQCPHCGNNNVLKSKARQATAHKNGNATAAKNIVDENTVTEHGRREP
jgi:cytochrome c-type biogenesis protein CcmH/NrfF